MRALVAGYIGGKSRLAKRIIERIPAHTCYVEPFAGAAWVLFSKPPSKSEILNDINSELTTLYRCVQHHLEEFVRYFKWVLVSREEFQRLKKQPPECLTDIQRAARFFYLQQSAYAGRIDQNMAFGVATSCPPRLNLLRIEEELSAAHLRLAHVFVECRSYADILRRYDRPDTFFYLDPPYFDNEADYGRGIFCKDDFGNLASILSGLKGKFLLSINDVPEIRATFAGFNIEPLTVTYSCSLANPTKAKELFISNY